MLKQILQILVAAFWCAAAAAAGPMAASLDDIRSQAEKIQSVSARFIQEKHMKILVKPLVSTGIFIYQAPDSLRFEYKTPIKNILVMHGGTVSRYIQKGDTLVRDNAGAMGSMQVVMDEITRWMQGDFDTKAFDATVVDTPEPGRIILTPRDKAMARFIQAIEMGLSEHPGVFRDVTIREDADSFTRLLFQDVAINAPVDQAVFEIRP
ncbi:MAG: outer membrane lipoprotein carrier protein LolA [Pseudomonadota bacterium]